MTDGDKWICRDYPDGCRKCGQTLYRHVGQGLCGKDYRRYSKSDAPTVEEWLLRRDDDGPFVETSHDNFDEHDEPLAPLAGGEVRPGSSGSSLGDANEPTPDDSPKPKRGLLGDLFAPKKNPPKPTQPKTPERRPKGTERRVSASDTLSDLYAAVGGFIGRQPQHAPLGRYLAWQAPAAGEILDDALKGTFVDKKLVQPAVKARASLDALVAVLGPPALIFAIERNPARANVLIPALKSSIRSSLPTLLPAMKKSQDREKKIDDAVREMFPELPPDVDPVDEILAQMFEGFFTFATSTNENVDANVGQ